MTRNEIIEFAQNNPVCFLSTVFENEPFVRAIMLYRADGEGLTFSTFIQKDLYCHLVKNRAVEICFYNHARGKQVRIRGEVVFIDGDEQKKEALQKFRFLRKQVAKLGLDAFILFRLKTGRATAWSLATAFDEKVYVDF